MADLSSLTKKQLLELLRQKEEAEKLQSQNTPLQETIVQASSLIKPPLAAKTQISAVGKLCQYRPVRSNQNPCIEQSINKWSFCKKHRQTVQAKKARERWEAENTSDLRISNLSSSPVPAQVQSVTQFSVDNTRKAKPIRKYYTQEKMAIKNNRDPSRRKTVKIFSNLRTSHKRKDEKSKSVRIPSLIPIKAKTKTRASKKTFIRRSRIPPAKGIRKPTVRKMVIRPNYWGRFEDPNTHIVFDPISKCAYGVQDISGKLLALTSKHIAICERNGWNYNSLKSDSDVEEVSSEEWDDAEYSEASGSEDSDPEDSDPEDSNPEDSDPEESDPEESDPEKWNSEENGGSEAEDRDENGYEEISDEDEYYEE